MGAGLGAGGSSAGGGGETRRALSVNTAAAEVQCSDCHDRRDQDSDGGRGGRDESAGGREGAEGGGKNGEGTAEGKERNDGKEGKEVDDPESLQWMVQGSLPLLIPHEPVLNSAELSVRIQAMQDTVVHPSSLLQGARSTMIAFAGENSENGENGENSFSGEDCTTCGANCSGGGTRGGTRRRRRGLWLPSGLREHERSVLHSEARDIGLYHISLGEGAERYE